MEKIKTKGFTLIELMITVAIIGILAWVAMPKFADMIRKSKEAATKGNMGTLRSAITIYYSDNQGQFPRDSDDTLSSLTNGSKYLWRIPMVYTPTHHLPTDTVHTCDNPIVATNDGYSGWNYSFVDTRSDWGNIFVCCWHKDIKGADWFTN